MRLSEGMGIFILLAWLCTGVWAQNRLEELEKKILSQQQQIKELEAQVENKGNDVTTSAGELSRQNVNYTEELVDEYVKLPDAEDDAPPMIGYDHGFFIRTGDGDFELKLKGEMMWQAIVMERRTIYNDTFLLRRNRLDTHFYFKKDWHARLRLGFDQNVDGVFQTQVREAYIEYLGISFLKPRVGVMKVPFSMEFLQDRTDQLAIAYSPFVTMDSMPRRDAGLMIYGDGLPFLMGDFFADYFSYAVGMFNGDQGTTSNDGNINTNADDDFAVVGAMRIFPFTQEEQRVFMHMALYYADTDYRANGSRIRLDGLRNHEVWGRNFPGGAVETVDNTNGKHFGFDIGGQFWMDNLRIEGEFMYMRMYRDVDLQNIPAAIAVDREPLQMYGVSAAISYFICLGTVEGMGIEPLFKFSYTAIDDKDGETNDGATRPPFGTVTDIQGQDIWEIVFGARFHYNEHLRLDFNWIMYDLDKTRGLSNNERGSGGGMMHSFMFQVMTRW